MSLFLVIAMYAVWTTVFSLGKMALLFSSPIFLTSSRMILAGFLLLGYLFFLKKEKFTLQKYQIFPLILLAFFSIYLTNILEFWGLQHLSASKTCFIYSLSPFFAAFFSYLHFGEKMNAKKWIGFAIGFAGFFPVLYLQKGSENFLGGITFISWPEFAIIGASLSSVYGWVLLRLLVKDNSLSPIMANGFSMFLGGFFALIHSFFVDSWNPIPVASEGLLDFGQGLLLMTLISNILCYNLYGWLLKRYTATFLSFFGLLSPIFASFTGWLLLGEAPSLLLLSSTFVIIFGLWIIYQQELKQGYILPKKVVLNPAE